MRMQIHRIHLRRLRNGGPGQERQRHVTPVEPGGPSVTARGPIAATVVSVVSSATTNKPRLAQHPGTFPRNCVADETLADLAAGWRLS